MSLLEDPVKTLPAMPAPDDIAAWERYAEALEPQWIEKYAPHIKELDPKIEEISLGGVTCYDIRRKDWKDDGKVLIYLHGGGYVYYRIGGSMLGRAVAVVDLWNLRIVAVEFSHAPRCKFDAITDECVAAIRALVASGIPMKNIAMYGDSAGGSMAAAVTLKMRDQGMGLPAALAMMSPWLDVTLDPDTMVSMVNQEASYTVYFHMKNMAAAWADPKDQKNPYASPVYGDFTKGYCPTMIQGGLKEVLLSGMVRMYEKLEDAGIPVKLDCGRQCRTTSRIAFPMPPSQSGRARGWVRFCANTWDCHWISDASAKANVRSHRLKGQTPCGRLACDIGCLVQQVH
jgi:acetyl esterase/lipase